MMKYRIDTIGCQMNVADSRHLASELEKLGCQSTEDIDEADVLVLNTCVVRQKAEDRAYDWLHRASKLKNSRKTKPILGLMGCLVGVKGNPKLAKSFPDVDVFLPPSDPSPMVRLLTEHEISISEHALVVRRHALQDGDKMLPMSEQGNLVSAHVPVVYGCSHACTFCIIPFRRGIERSRPVGEIAAEVRSLSEQGVKEVTLLGQIVDRYGMDIPDGPNLAQLLQVIHDTRGIERIRFLTSHPNYITDELLDTVAGLPKICEHIEVPVQAGNNTVLQNMRRNYNAQQYRELIHRIRDEMPHGSIACDVIVGFPGETEKQFQDTYNLLADLKLDKVHIAKYSARPGTVSARRMQDDIPDKEKELRRKALDELQANVVSNINQCYLGQVVEVLVENKRKDKWFGRTRTNKLVFFESSQNCQGQLLDVEITWAGPWSMQARITDRGHPTVQLGQQSTNSLVS